MRVGEGALGLAERGREGAGEDLEGGEVLLEIGDPDRQLLGAGIESGEAFFHLARAGGEMGDVLRELVLEGQARPPEAEPGPDRDHRAHEGQQRAEQDQD